MSPTLPSDPSSDAVGHAGGQPPPGRPVHSLLKRVASDQRVRFLVVGAFNTGFSYAVFASLVLTLSQRIHYLVLLVIAHIVTVLVAYVLYRRFVFAVRDNFFRDLPKFWTVYLWTLAVNLVLLPALVNLAGLPVLGAQLLFVIVAASNAYFGHKYFSFRRPTDVERS